LTLIQQPAAERDLGLSERMRESVLASISDAAETSPPNAPAARQALESVAAAIDAAGSPLTIGERTLMRELLARLADES
jgi:phage gp36-like protein